MTEGSFQRHHEDRQRGKHERMECSSIHPMQVARCVEMMSSGPPALHSLKLQALRWLRFLRFCFFQILENQRCKELTGWTRDQSCTMQGSREFPWEQHNSQKWREVSGAPTSVSRFRDCCAEHVVETSRLLVSHDWGRLTGLLWHATGDRESSCWRIINRIYDQQHSEQHVALSFVQSTSDIRFRWNFKLVRKRSEEGRHYNSAHLNTHCAQMILFQAQTSLLGGTSVAEASAPTYCLTSRGYRPVVDASIHHSMKCIVDDQYHLFLKNASHTCST